MVLCALVDSRIKVKLQSKFLALYSGTNLNSDSTRSAKADGSRSVRWGL